MNHYEAIIAALRSKPHEPWSARTLSIASGVPSKDVTATLISLRWAGKVEFDRYALTPSMLADATPAQELSAPDIAPSLTDIVHAEATASVANRRRAQMVGMGASAVEVHSAGEALATALVEEVRDGMRAVERRWPALWQRVLRGARANGQRPGEFFADALQHGIVLAEHGQPIDRHA